MNSTSTKTERNMRVLRIAVLSSFVLMVGVTAASLLTHIHGLHIAHIVFVNLTFLLIAVYLQQSAVIASLTAYRELKLRITVDDSYRFVEHMRNFPSNRLFKSNPVYNVCAGALAKSGIYVRCCRSVSELAILDSVSVYGNSPNREGYDVTKSVLSQIGVKLGNTPDKGAVRVKLGAFEPDSDKLDFILTNDKITHLLKAVYISKVYVKLWNRMAMFGAIVLFMLCILIQFRQLMYMFIPLVLFGTYAIYLVRQVERAVERITFDKIVNNFKRRNLKNG